MHSSQLSFPVLPGVVAKIIEEVNRPGSSSRSVGDLVQADPALSARVLRIANSAAYGGLTEICDLPRAISRMGSALVVAVVVGCASKETLSCRHPQLLTVAKDAWARAIRAAPFARLFASRRGVDPGLAFMGALLHCSGITVLVQLIETLSGDDSRDLPGSSELEVVLAALAPVAGARLLERWKLPKAVSEAVRYQASPASASPSYERLAGLVGVASEFATLAIAGDGDGLAERLRARKCVEDQEASADELQELIHKALEHSHELHRLFA